MRRVYIVVVLIGVAAILVDHLSSPVERPRGVAGGFRRRLRALWRALSVEKINAPTVIFLEEFLDFGARRCTGTAAKFRAFECGSRARKAQHIGKRPPFGQRQA